MQEAAEKCGVAGVYLYDGSNSASKSLYNLLLALYHRGHEGAGIASRTPSGSTLVYRRLGRVRDVFKDGDVAERLDGNVAIGQTRYGTVGLNNPRLYLHPIRSPRGMFHLGHNGTIAPYELEELSKEFPKSNRFDTQVLTALIESMLIKTVGDWADALNLSSNRLDGSYTSTVLTKDGKLIAFREPRGFKPLNYGEIDGGYVVASETSALDSIQARNIKPVKPGEVVIVDKNGLVTKQFAEPNPTPCVFEYLYFSDVGSVIDGIPCYDVRVNVGRRLAQKYPINADAVIPIPDSGRAGAVGYSLGSGLPLVEGIRINREVGRVFILPSEQRDDAMRRKYLPIKSAIEGKSIVVVDDSIVRGQTTRSIVSILREAGAKEVHVFSTFPPISFPCVHGGVAFASRRELAINKYDGIEGLKSYINADSLSYSSVEDLKALGLSHACFACITGEYPLKHVPDLEKVSELEYVRG